MSPPPNPHAPPRRTPGRCNRLAAVASRNNSLGKRGCVVQQRFSVSTYSSLLLLFAAAGCLAGCDLQPSPKSTAPSGTEPVATAPVKDASVPPDTLAVTPGCLNVATHVAQVLIDGATDPALRSTYERARTKMVQTMSEACTARGWSTDIQRCYLNSKTEAQARACTPAPPPE